MKLKRLDTSESKDIEKKNKSQLSDKMEKQINHQNPQEFHRSYQEHLKKIGVVHNGADVLMQQNSYSGNFSTSYSGTVVPDRNENQAESHRLPNAALDYRELNLQSYRNQYMQRIEVPALMINKKKILCQVPKVTHEDVEWDKSGSHPIYREHVLLSNSTKQKQVVEINEQSQSTTSNENHVSDYMNQDNQSEQNQTDIRLMELQRQFEEHPNGNLRKHYESERIPFYEKAEEKLENVKNPFTDLEDDNIQLVDIRLLELEREFRSHPNGNPAKQYKSQNYSSHISEEYQGAERKNKVAVNVEKDSDFIKKNRIQMEVVTPIEIGDEQSEIETDIRRLELERNLTEDALDGDSLKDKKSLDRVSQKIERQKNRILEENRYFQIGENPETIFGSQQTRGTAYGEDLESESPFDSEENERLFDEMVKDQEGENFNQEHTDTEKSKKKEKDDSEKSSYFVKKDSRKIGKIAQNAEKISNLSRVIDHEMNALYDSEERKKSAAKDYITGKIKGKIKGSAASAAKKAGKKVAEKTVALAIRGVKAAASFLVQFLPIVGIIIVIAGIIIGIGAGVAEYENQQQQGGGQGGYFGKMYYWIEYETGKTDDTAFATVLGDGGRAFGIQFDYEYALQPFMNYCYNRNPIAYVGFQPYLSMPKSNLLGNQQLAKAWTIIFETNKEAFIQDQKDFAKENYYDGIERRAEQAGIKLKDRDGVCKGAVLSYSFQCGGSAAYQAVEELRAISDDEEFLKQIYAVRTREFSRFQDRYKRELETALSLLHGQGDFVPPVDMSKCVVTSEFGEYRSPSDPSHKGTDFGSIGAVAVPTYAIGDGTVLIAGYSSSAGNWVVIDHGNGLVAKYMHHESIKVRVGQQVKKGEQIGNMGTTGDSTGVHLHLQLELNDVPVNPRNYITF